jgi:glycosyltransferase involved in cell wall biosynthesis
MKIIQIVCSYPPYRGGIGNSAYNFQKIFARTGESWVFTARPVNQNISTGGVIYLNPWLRSGLGAWMPQLIWRLKKYDIIYFHYPYFGTALATWLSAVLFNKKLIVHYHMDVSWNGGWRQWIKPFFQIFDSLLFHRAEKIVMASIDYAQNGQLAGLYRKHPEKFVVVPFAVDTNHFAPMVMRRPSSSPRLLFVGGLDSAHYFKGISVLLRALSKIKDENWKLEIVGEGNLKSGYQKEAEDLGLGKRIEFSGRIDDTQLAEVYRGADIFVLPSINRNEAFGIVLLEAMATGLPVVASSLPGVRTVFTDGQQGLYAKPNDADDLADKIKYLLDNPDKLQSMSQAARELAENEYSTEKISNRLLKVVTRA